MIEIDYIFDQDKINHLKSTGKIEEWKVKCYQEFRKTMLDENNPFPCYFGVEAEKNGWVRYLFIESAYDENELLKVKQGLEEYLKVFRDIGKRTTLVIFFKPLEKIGPAEEYKRQFWNLLNYLYNNDPKPWPEDIPANPNHPKWEFCFAGEPMFIVARAPFYLSRRSRYCPCGLEITIQPRDTLEDITGDTLAGKQARKIIRERLENYDLISLHPDIGDYGDQTKREWKQYILPDTNEESVMRCPITGRVRNS